MSVITSTLAVDLYEFISTYPRNVSIVVVLSLGRAL